MKKKILIAMLLFSNVVFGQTRSEVFDSKVPVTWLGLDFTAAMFIGDREKLGSGETIRSMLYSWNNLVINEPEKYDIAKAIGRTSIEKDISVTEERIAALKVDGMYSDKTADHLHVSASDVEEIVRSYNFKGSGIGLLFVVESFNKLNTEASMYVTFINMANKEVLFTERVTAPPGGFGLRNYWAGAIYTVLKNLTKKEFEMWRKKHQRS